MEIIIILAWIGCAYWCSQIAKRNGRNALIATVAGLLFGIFVVILSSIAGEEKNYRTQKISGGLHAFESNCKKSRWLTISLLFHQLSSLNYETFI